MGSRSPSPKIKIPTTVAPKQGDGDESAGQAVLKKYKTSGNASGLNHFSKQQPQKKRESKVVGFGTYASKSEVQTSSRLQKKTTSTSASRKLGAKPVGDIEVTGLTGSIRGFAGTKNSARGASPKVKMPTSGRIAPKKDAENDESF